MSVSPVNSHQLVGGMKLFWSIVYEGFVHGVLRHCSCPLNFEWRGVRNPGTSFDRFYPTEFPFRMDKTRQRVPRCVKQRLPELIIISFVGIEYHYKSERFITDSDLLASQFDYLPRNIINILTPNRIRRPRFRQSPKQRSSTKSTTSSTTPNTPDSLAQSRKAPTN